MTQLPWSDFEDKSLPYEIVASGRYQEHTAVIPAFRQDVYFKSQCKTDSASSVLGLDAVMIGNYTLMDDNMTLPYNVY